ncbi:MAG: AraC family transcriptional regulator [Gammaproteobacteria bacterium]|nr:AraC family transcriptional regulator [Gammaproteobacteria bacterium]
MPMIKYYFLLLVLLLSSAALQAAEKKTPQATAKQSLQSRVQDLKKQVLELNRDLFQLQEELLFPANTQFTVFLSFDIGNYFNLDAVQVKLDDKIVANHLYTERELNALKRGGTQRLYLGNLASGEHELVAFFTGKGPKGRDYRRGSSIKLKKGSEPQFIELQITDDTRQQQPEFKIKVWD